MRALVDLCPFRHKKKMAVVQDKLKKVEVTKKVRETLCWWGSVLLTSPLFSSSSLSPSFFLFPFVPSFHCMWTVFMYTCIRASAHCFLVHKWATVVWAVWSWGIHEPKWPYLCTLALFLFLFLPPPLFFRSFALSFLFYHFFLPLPGSPPFFLPRMPVNLSNCRQRWRNFDDKRMSLGRKRRSLPRRREYVMT